MELFFDGQRDDEQVVFVWRRNLATLLKESTVVLILSLAVVYSLLNVGASLLTSLLIGVWLIGVPVYGGIAWFRWWNDLYILTNQRLVDVDQKRLFHRAVAEASLENIQDVSFETKGILQTVLNYGHVIVQTASVATEIDIDGVTDPQAVQQAILRTAQQRRRARNFTPNTADQSAETAESSRTRETHTFFFTDLVDSTAIWEKNREAMEQALERHDQLLQEIIQEHGGSVFKTAGDAILAVFPDPVGALKAGLAVQERIQAEDWMHFGDLQKLQVKIAIHVGTAQARDNDYFGPALNRTARVLGEAKAGQLLLSSTAYELLQDDVPFGISVQKLGSKQLKGLKRPETIYSVSSQSVEANRATVYN